MAAVVNNFVEIIGPPGSGKSTLYKKLCQTWNKKSGWIYEDALLAPEKPNLLQPLALLEYTFKKLAGRQMAKNISSEYGLRLVQKEPELPTFLWGVLSSSFIDSNIKDYLQFRSAYFLFQDFSRYQAIIDKKSPLPCLIEEGFLQKSFFIDEQIEDLSQLLDKYISVIPLPRLLIVLYAENFEVVLNRIKNRKKMSLRHRDMDSNDILIEIKKWDIFNKLIVTKFQKLNIPVEYINAEKQLEVKLGELKIIMENLS